MADNNLFITNDAAQRSLGNNLNALTALSNNQLLQNQNQLYQQQNAANIGIGQIVQQNIDPQTGQVDLGGVLKDAAKNPATAYNFLENLGKVKGIQGQDITNQTGQFNLQSSKLDRIGQLTGTLADKARNGGTITPNDIAALGAHLAANNVDADTIAKDFSGIDMSDPKQLADAVIDLHDSHVSPAMQLQMKGQGGTINTPQGVYGQVTVPGQAPRVTGMLAPNLLSAADYAKPTTYIDPQTHQTIQTTQGQVLASQGVGPNGQVMPTQQGFSAKPGSPELAALDDEMRKMQQGQGQAPDTTGANLTPPGARPLTTPSMSVAAQAPEDVARQQTTGSVIGTQGTADYMQSGKDYRNRNLQNNALQEAMTAIQGGAFTGPNSALITKVLETFHGDTNATDKTEALRKALNNAASFSSAYSNGGQNELATQSRIDANPHADQPGTAIPLLAKQVMDRNNYQNRGDDVFSNLVAAGKANPSDYTGFAKQYAKDHDPRAFGFRQEPPEVQMSILDSLKTARDKARFTQGLAEADKFDSGAQ